MDKRSMIKYNGDSTKTKDSDQNEDDSIIGSDELSDLRFSSQDNLLDSSQDGDSQCDVKWDYTSPQTMRQLRKMKGKYSADDVKKIVAKFPDLPVKSPESSFSNIKIMLPPKNAADVIEKSKQLRAKQREMKLLRKRQKSKQVAQDMILFLHQEQQKQEQEAAEKLRRSSDLDPVNDPAHKVNNNEDNTATIEKSKEDADDECWSDDDLFMDNSFLIEATQNPEKFFTKEKQQLAIGHKSATQSNPNSSSSHVSKSDQLFEVSMSAKHVFPSNEDTSPLSDGVIPSSIQAGFSERNKTLNKFLSKTGNQPGRNRCEHSVKSNQSKSSANYGTTSYKRAPFQKHLSSCDNQISASKADSFSSNKILTTSVKSPFRKCLSFDASKAAQMNIVPMDKGSKKNSLYLHHQNVHTAYPNLQKKSFVPNHQNNKALNSCHSKQTAEQDLFDSSLSDELLLQATLSQELAMKCPGSQPISSSSNAEKEKIPSIGAFIPSHCPSVGASKLMESTSKSSQRKEDNDVDNITNLLLSPVRPGKEDFQDMPKMSSKSPLLRCSNKEKFSIPSHMAAKHKSFQRLSSSTPVKYLRAQKDDCSDSFLEKAFEDSFNDEALFESQILPMLELAESQVQKASSSVIAPVASSSSHSPIKCSPEEIEVKRQRAIHKRSLRLAQMNHRKS